MKASYHQSGTSPPIPAGRKTKVLLVGAVESHLELLHGKLTTLNGGKAGPFDCAFVSGRVWSSSAVSSPSLGLGLGLGSIPKFPIPVYFSDCGTAPEDISDRINVLDGLLAAKAAKEMEEGTEDTTTATTTVTTTATTTATTTTTTTTLDNEMCPSSNLFYLGVSGLGLLHNLVVCWKSDNHNHALPPVVEKATSDPQFIGVDLLLTSEFPQNLLSIFPPKANAGKILAQVLHNDKNKDKEKEKDNDGNDNENGNENGNENDNDNEVVELQSSTFGSADTAELATKVRPRYHIIGAEGPTGVHLVAHPYTNSSTTVNKKFHPTR